MHPQFSFLDPKIHRDIFGLGPTIHVIRNTIGRGGEGGRKLEATREGGRGGRKLEATREGENY
jgi:hypothetical protein